MDLNLEYPTHPIDLGLGIGFSPWTVEMRLLRRTARDQVCKR